MFVEYPIVCHHCFRRSQPHEVDFRCAHQAHSFAPRLGDFWEANQRIHYDEALCAEHQVYCTERSCSGCKKALPNYAGRYPESMVAVAGARGSGKTILTLAILEALINRAANRELPGYVPMFEDEESQIAFVEKYQRLVTDNQLPAATGGRDPDPIRVRLHSHSGRKREFLVFHDGPGEVVESLEDVRYVRYLANATTIILTLDTQRLIDSPGDKADDEAGSPATVLNAIVNNVRSERGIGNAQRIPLTLRVTFTKCDATVHRDFPDLTPLPMPDFGGASGKPEQRRREATAWVSKTRKRLQALSKQCPHLLREWGHDNFVNMLREFRGVQFYTTSALTHCDGRFQLNHLGVLEPLLASFGVLEPAKT